MEMEMEYLYRSNDGRFLVVDALANTKNVRIRLMFEASTVVHHHRVDDTFVIVKDRHCDANLLRKSFFDHFGVTISDVGGGVWKVNSSQERFVMKLKHGF